MLYDTIGRGYRTRRQPDARIGAQIHEALGDSRRILNVGAGAGSYEPADRDVLAVEPSQVMVAQRPGGAAPAVRAVADALPFDDDSFDAAMASLTIHHWPDWEAGLTEVRRVTRDRIVLFTFDPDYRRFWLYDYFPGVVALDNGRMPTLERLANVLGEIEVATVEIPADCTDGFQGAYWKRPEAYLDADVRASISTFPALEDPQPGLDALASDLASGAWQERYGDVMSLDAVDLGYRIVTATSG